MDNGNIRTLTINIGKENQSVVEDITKEKIDKSFFSEQYREALRVINAYLDHLPKPSTNDCKKKEDRFKEDDANNIIAFVGDRGSGKTSCMESVAKYLASNNKDIDEYNKVKEQKFYALSLVEPAFFDDEHNVVSLVIASLYDEFCKEDKNLDKDHEKKLRVAKCFSKVQEELEWMVSKYADNNSDTFEKLTNLANAVKLKQDIKTLVDEFLDFMGYGKEAILLLCIDDIDLNTKCADRMTESIRKYLIQTNILVLLSAKVEQLEKVKQLAFVNEYKNLLEKEEKTGFTHKDVKEMVDKFITKFLPRVHRIHMPEIGMLDGESLIIKDKGGVIRRFSNRNEAIPALIKEKTGMLFYKSQNGLNRINPKNLRELCQLVRLLYEMDGNIPKWDNAKNLLTYLFDEWAEKHLDTERYGAIKEIFDNAVEFNHNKVVVGQLYSVFRNTIDEWKEEDDNRFNEVKAIIDKYNQPRRVTLGDVFGIMSLLEEEHRGSEDQTFFFLIKAYYTIILSRVNSLKEDYGYNLYWYDNEGNWNNILYPYRRLINGNFINSNIVETMTPERQSGDKRSIRLVDLGKLRSIIKEVINENDIAKLHFVEIIVLCLGRNYETRYDKEFRKKGDSDYDRDLQDIKRAYFDVNSYMYNVLDLDMTYKRIGKELIDYVQNNETSLYWKLREAQKKASSSSNQVLITDSESLIRLTQFLNYYQTRIGGFVYNLWQYFRRLSVGVSYKIDNVEQKLNYIGSEEIAEELLFLRRNTDVEEFAQGILNVVSKKDGLISIDKLSILKREQDYFTSSEIKYNIERTHPFYKDEKNKKKLDKVFTLRGRFTKEQIKSKIDEYNKSLQ